ncbi:MAG: sigma-54-dependent Fis family transcriptional regulator [Chloroflexi bacterium]|nr:sigma-54-dependent Fis family transcriptional regulator [Chloroflexota bacterium]
MTTVLIVDDERNARSFLRQILQDHKYEATEADSLTSAYAQVERGEADIVLLDLGLPDGNGLTLLERIAREAPGLPVIVITGFDDVETVVDAMQSGAQDFIHKPIKLPRLLKALGRAADTVALRRELALLRRSHRDHDEWIVGETPAMKQIAETVARVAASNANVLISGESGTGKEVVAHAIHTRSPRAGRAFMAINCASGPEELFESELFGHEAGAFTTANKRKEGLMEVADGGTLFLDEISSMKTEVQAKLLRAIEEHKIRRLGATSDITIDARVLAASNRNIPEMIKAEKFRPDLYYRLNVVPIHLPPLRERRPDIPQFVGAFISKFNLDQGRSVQGCSARAMEALKAYGWPGNIRELRNVIERAMLFCDGETLDVGHLPVEIQGLLEKANGSKPAATVKRGMRAKARG